MAELRPFRALHPPAELAARVAAPPYDVVDVAQARALTRDNPEHFLHVTRPEVDVLLRPEGGPASPAGAEVPAGAGAAPEDDVHARAWAKLDGFVRRGVLLRDPEPALWVYRAEREGRVQTGFAGCVSVAEYDAGVIRVHEHTRPDKEADRVAHVDALDAHDEPVLLLHRPDEGLRDLARTATAGAPAFDLLDEDGVRHALWRVDDPGQVTAVVQAFAGLERLYVADGHHRSAAASRVHALRAEREDADPGETDAFLAVAFPADELTVLPYHRLVRDLDGLRVEDVLRRLHPDFEVVVSPGPVEPTAPRVFGLYVEGTWYELCVREDTVEGADAVHGLDVSVLQEYCLGPVLGIADPRRDPRLAFVGGVHGVAELVRAVDSGEAAAAFTLRATRVEDLLAVSDLGEVMPPKSTWFEPKLRSGLLVHPFH